MSLVSSLLKWSWLWLGLLFPIGAIAALGRPGAPVWLVLGQTVTVVAAGLVLGGALLALRAAGDGEEQSSASEKTMSEKTIDLSH